MVSDDTRAQATCTTNLQDRLHSFTTVIEVEGEGGVLCRGTGVFFTPEDPSVPAKTWGGNEFRKVSSWLITNRHVLLPRESRPRSVAFGIRVGDKSGGIAWHRIRLDGQAVERKALVHADRRVDLAVLNVTEEVDNTAGTALEGAIPIAYSGVSADDFPDKSIIRVEATSDVVVIGYPWGFYDEFNKFPVIKTGIIASRWGANFQSLPAFLIDAKLFPGSSGSLVISKPSDTVVAEPGVLSISNIGKQFCFLGIFSGEPYQVAQQPVETEEGFIRKKERLDVGLVWYYYLVPEILRNGKTI